jgi:hypothetical protein
MPFGKRIISKRPCRLFPGPRINDLRAAEWPRISKRPVPVRIAAAPPLGWIPPDAASRSQLSEESQNPVAHAWGSPTDFLTNRRKNLWQYGSDKRIYRHFLALHDKSDFDVEHISLHFSSPEGVLYRFYPHGLGVAPSDWVPCRGISRRRTRRMKSGFRHHWPHAVRRK